MSVAQEILAEKSKELVAETQGKQKTSSKKASSIKDLVVAYKKEIAKALPEGIDASRFERMVQSALSANEDLQKCTPMSILAAMLSAAQLGLEPNTPLGQAYLIPFKAWKPKEKKEVLECQFQIGYKGLLELAYRTGNYKIIDAHAVYENDEFDFSYGLDAKLYHKPALYDKGRIIAFYAMYQLTNGGYRFEVMSKEDIDSFKVQHSKSCNSSYSPWKTSYVEMALKTVLKRVLKFAPMSTEFANAFYSDGAIKHDIQDDMSLVKDDYIDISNTNKTADSIVE